MKANFPAPFRSRERHLALAALACLLPFTTTLRADPAIREAQPVEDHSQKANPDSKPLEDSARASGKDSRPVTDNAGKAGTDVYAVLREDRENGAGAGGDRAAGADNRPPTYRRGSDGAHASRGPGSQ